MKKYLVSVVFVSALILVGSGTAHASSPLTGYAWSSNIGWISFSGTALDNSPYGVTMATTSHSTIATLTGYAWSSNIGWIKFGGLDKATMPDTPNGENASIDMNTGRVYGWAQACFGTANNDCSGGPSSDASMVASSWIRLSDINKYGSPDLSGPVQTLGSVTFHTSLKGVTFDAPSGAFSGYAWSPLMGWIKFGVSTVGVQCSNCQTPVGIVSGACLVSVDNGATYQYNASIASGNSVLYGIQSLSGGTPPYKFYWNGSVTPSSVSTYGPVTLTNTVWGGIYYSSTTDSASHSTRMPCPTVNVTSAASGPLVLRIGVADANNSGRNANQTSLPVNRGTKFGLSWVNNLPAYQSSDDTGYKCRQNSPTQWGDSPWHNAIVPGNGWTTTAMDTSGIKVDTYEFDLTCTQNSPTYDEQTASVTLKVTSGTESEI